MIVPTYVPGEWVAVVTDGTLAVLPPQTPPALVTELWASIREGAALTDHLQVLLRAGIAGLPPFALVNLQGGRVHVIVRGAVSVEVTTATGVRLVSAPHVSTWAEELVTDAQGVVVRTATGSVPPEAWSALPVLAAVVHADLVLVDLRSEVPLRPEPATLSSGELRILPPPPPAPVGVGPAAAPAVPVARTSGSDGAERSVPAWEPVRPARPERVFPGRRAEAEPRPATPGAGVQRAPEPERALSEVGRAQSRAAEVRTADVSRLEPARVERVDPAAPRPAAGSEDHDGLTVLSSDVVALRRELPGWAGDAVPALAVPTPRTPPPAKILLSSGLVVSLNRPVLLGRAPQVTRVSNSEIPRLVTVASPNQDISRTHAEVRMEGEDVLVTDLRSTNGVLLLRQGAGPQRLHPGEPTVVEEGVVVDLGEGVTFIVEAGG